MSVLKQTLQSAPPSPQQPDRRRKVSARVDDFGDTLTVKQLLDVLQLSRSQYHALKAHGVFPIEPLEGLGAIRYSRDAVTRYLERQRSTAMRLMRKAG